MGFRSTTHFQRFPRGELDPSSKNANQLEQFREGCERARNFLIDVQGNLQTRAEGVRIDGGPTEPIGGGVLASSVGTKTARRFPGTDATQSAFGRGGFYTWQFKAGDPPIDGLLIKDLRQVPIISSNERFWHINPGRTTQDKRSGQIPAKDDDRVTCRGVGTLSGPNHKMIITSISNSLVPLQSAFGPTYINDEGLKVGTTRFRPYSMRIGDDGKPRMTIKYSRNELDRFGDRRRKITLGGFTFTIYGTTISVGGQEYFTRYNNPPRVEGAALLRVLDNLVLYVYSRYDHRTYRLPFKEAQVETENFRNDRNLNAHSDDEIILMWDVSTCASLKGNRRSSADIFCECGSGQSLAFSG